MAVGGVSMDDETAPTEAELEAIRSSDPDPLGLMYVMELIAPEARVTGWERLHGGLAGAVHRIDVTMPSGAEIAFVLRRYLPETGADGRLATREAETLERLRDTLVTAPEALWLDADGVVFGRPALATTLLPGRVRTADLHDDPRVVAGLAEALVSLRWVPLDAVEHLPRREDPTALVADLRGPVPTSPLLDTRAVADVLLAHAGAVTPEPVALSHGDFHVGNVLFDGTRPSGIVDWDHARVADPRADVAYCALDLALVAGPEVAETFLEEHAALRGEMADAAWWRLQAAADAFPDPRDWVRQWGDLGVDVTPEQVAERYVAWVEQALAELG